MLRPIYRQMISLDGFTEDESPTPWHKQLTPKPLLENERAQMLWDMKLQRACAQNSTARLALNLRKYSHINPTLHKLSMPS